MGVMGDMVQTPSLTYPLMYRTRASTILSVHVHCPERTSCLKQKKKGGPRIGEAARDEGEDDLRYYPVLRRALPIHGIVLEHLGGGQGTGY